MSVAMSAEETRARCAALTHAGAPCKNYPLPGSLYCRAHQPSVERSAAEAPAPAHEWLYEAQHDRDLPRRHPI